MLWRGYILACAWNQVPFPGCPLLSPFHYSGSGIIERSEFSICYYHMWNIKLYFAFFEQTAHNKCNDKVTFVRPVRLFFHLGKNCWSGFIEVKNGGATVKVSRKCGFALYICQILDTKHRSNLICFIINNLQSIYIIWTHMSLRPTDFTWNVFKCG